MSDVSQCPFCELRFRGKWELQLHLDSDHPGRVKAKDKGEVVIEENDPNDPEPL